MAAAMQAGMASMAGAKASGGSNAATMGTAVQAAMQSGMGAAMQAAGGQQEAASDDSAKAGGGSDEAGDDGHASPAKQEEERVEQAKNEMAEQVGSLKPEAQEANTGFLNNNYDRLKPPDLSEQEVMNGRHNYQHADLFADPEGEEDAPIPG